MKEQPLCKAVEATEAEKSGTKEAEGEINLPKKINGKIRNILIEIRKDTHPQVSQRQKMTPKTHLVHLSPVKQTV